MGGRETYKLCSDYQMNQTPLRCVWFITLGGNQKIYTISFNATADQFDQHKATFEKCAATILVD